jgi:transposase-like protein
MNEDITEKERREPAEDDYKRWTAKRKAAVVLDLIKGITTPAEVARKHALTVAEVESWVEAFQRGGEDRLRSNPRDREAVWEAERKDLYAKIGELTLEKEILKKTHRVLGKELPEGIS